MAREKMGQEPKAKASQAILVFPQRGKEACHQGLPRCERDLGKDQEYNKSSTFATTTSKGSKPHICLTTTTTILSYLPRANLHPNPPLHLGTHLLPKLPTHMVIDTYGTNTT